MMSTNNSNGTNGNRARDLPACSTVPQPIALPRSPLYLKYFPFSVTILTTRQLLVIFPAIKIEYVPSRVLQLLAYQEYGQTDGHSA
jgi:hypothetical protein